MLRTWVAVLFGLSIPAGGAFAQAPNCALFTSMSEEHGKKAQAIEQDAAERARTLSGEAAKTSADIAARAARSEWEMAALSREAARKCLEDFISGGQTTAVAPPVTAPVQQVAPAPVQQAPVVVRRAAPVVVQEAAPVVIQEAPVQQFHATAVSAIAAGGAALSTFGNRGSGMQQGGMQQGGGGQFDQGSRQMNEPPGTTTTRTTLPSGSISTLVRRPDGTETQIIQRPGESRPSFVNTIQKNPDGSSTGFQRSHSRDTSAVTTGRTVSTKSAGGGTSQTFNAIERNPDGTVSRGKSTITQFRPGGTTVVHATGTRSDGSKTEVQSRQFQNFTIMNTKNTSSDGGVTQERLFINTKTGAQRVLPNTPASSNPPRTTRPNWNRVIGRKN